MLKKVAQACGIATRVRAGSGHQRSLAEAEAAIGQLAERQQLGVDFEQGRVDQPPGFGRAKIELDDRARDIPRDGLASDQVVSLMMIECVGLEQPPVRGPEPFATIELVVGANMRDAARKLV